MLPRVCLMQCSRLGVAVNCYMAIRRYAFAGNMHSCSQQLPASILPYIYGGLYNLFYYIQSFPSRVTARSHFQRNKRQMCLFCMDFKSISWCFWSFLVSSRSIFANMFIAIQLSPAWFHVFLSTDSAPFYTYSLFTSSHSSSYSEFIQHRLPLWFMVGVIENVVCVLVY